MRLYQFGSVTLPANNPTDDFTVQAASGLIALPGGAFDQHGGALVLSPRRLTRQFEVWPDGSSSVQDLLDILMAEFAAGRKLLQAYNRDDILLHTFAKVLDLKMPRPPRTVGYQPLTVTWEVDYPYWLVRADEPIYLDDGYLLDGTWYLNAGQVESEAVTTTIHNFTIANAGGCAIPRGLLHIEPRAGSSIQNPKIANGANGMWIKYTGALSAGDELDLEFLPQAAYLNASGVYANVSIGSNQMQWMVLEVGSNAITVTADSITGTVDLYWQWSRHYLL